jgi:hypothetical protein
MDVTLINFLLQNIGFPIVTQIIAARKAANALATITSEQVIADFLADVGKWTKQGTDWLTANPKV